MLFKLVKEVESYLPGDPVSRELLERALTLFIEAEPDPSLLLDSKRYRESIGITNKAIDNANLIIRNFGMQIHPKNLSRMQDVYYDITNSPKYRQSGVICSVVRAALSMNWDGINGWQR